MNKCYQLFPKTMPPSMYFPNIPVCPKVIHPLKNSHYDIISILE